MKKIFLSFVMVAYLLTSVLPVSAMNVLTPANASGNVEAAGLLVENSTLAMPSQQAIHPKEVVDASFTLRNADELGRSCENVSVKIVSIGEGKVIGHESTKVKEINAGETKTIKFKVQAGISGGTKFRAVIKSNNVVVKEESLGGLTVFKGPGWFSGDTHNHTPYSDGKGTVAQNVYFARKFGMDFLLISDHNKSSDQSWQELQAEAGSDKIAIRGSEYSGPNHAVLVNVYSPKNYNTKNFGNDMQTIKSENNGRIMSYVAHPYEKYPATLDVAFKTNSELVGYDGIEVWNGWWGPRQIFNKYAFQKWDELNAKGRKLYAIADTDTHASEHVGKVFTSVFASNGTSEDIVDGYQAGHMYGSNGPVINMNIGHAMMGDTVKLSEKNKVKVHMTGNYYGGLTKAILIKNGQVYKEYELNGKTSFEISEKIELAAGDFIRMEVEGKETNLLKLDTDQLGELGYVSFDQAPFAFSNPIFVEQGVSDHDHSDDNDEVESE